MLKKQSKLFIDPKIHYPIDDMDLPFSDYITQCKTIIQKTRVDLNQNAEKIITANAPFELRPEKARGIGVLLIHGLMDSPFLFREIGEQFQAEGFLVRSILLPGHGTVPGALLNVDFHDWLNAVNYGFHSLAKEVDQIYLMGFSTGANLAIHQAIHHHPKIAGIILLSPAIRIHSIFASLARLPMYLSRLSKRLAWFERSAEETIDYAKYRSLPFNAIYQVYRSTQTLKKINAIQYPLFFAVSDADITVDGHQSIAYFQEHHHPDSRLLLYTTNDKKITDSRITLRDAAYPNLRIRNFSHVSLPFSINNDHYGAHGDFCYASHINTNSNMIYGEFSPHQLSFNNALYALNMRPARYERLSFNPDFPYMMQSILKFIEDTQKQPYN